VALEEKLEVQLSYEELAELTRDQMLRRALEVVQEAGIAGPEIDLPWMHRYVEGFRARLQAAHQYRARPYRGALTLLATATQRADNDPAAPWRGLAGEGVEVHAIPGSHESMLLEPHVQELAGILSRCLATAAGVLQR
jgi:thioesterase domain-containing protein